MLLASGINQTVGKAFNSTVYVRSYKLPLFTLQSASASLLAQKHPLPLKQGRIRKTQLQTQVRSGSCVAISGMSRVKIRKQELILLAPNEKLSPWKL